jgi:hypothetical protein
VVVVDYPGTRQLAARGPIAKEITEFEQGLTKRLLKFDQGKSAAVK